jgi:alpha-beta hydrolase superfamily lysophospholipase
VSDHTDYPTPYGLTVRGTVLVVPGRGETHASYHRLGTRLAADAYRVRIIDRPRIDPLDVAGSLARFATELAAATEAVVDRPLVLVGADAGAAAIGALTSTVDTTASWWPDAIVLAGVPGHAAAVTGTWDTELDVRTSCPVHRRVLTAGPGDERGSLGAALPDELLDIALDATTDVPRLVLIGDADPLADREALARGVKAAPRARLSVVHGAHHDVLNDVQHRSVAAEVVAFLETVRDDLVPVLTVESSAW